MTYLYSLLALIGIYSILTLSTNLLIGYGGIVSMSQASIFGIAAYSVGILTLYGVNWWLALLCAIVLTILANILLTLPSLRASGFCFMVITFAFSKVMTTFFSSAEITGGSYGLSGIPRASFFGIPISGSLRQLVFVWCILAVCFFVARKLINSPYGLMVEAMRQEPMSVDSLGKSTLKIKIINSAVSGVFAAIAGALYVQYMTFIEATSFNQDVSFNLTVFVFLGGAATMLGSIAGPVFMLLIPQLISLLPIPPAQTGPLQNLIYGLLLVLFMMFRPSGLVQKKPGGSGGAKLLGRLGIGKKAKLSGGDGNGAA